MPPITASHGLVMPYESEGGWGGGEHLAAAILGLCRIVTRLGILNTEGTADGVARVTPWRESDAGACCFFFLLSCLKYIKSNVKTLAYCHCHKWQVNQSQ